MEINKYLLVFAILFLMAVTGSSAQSLLESSQPFPDHPRILCLKGDEKIILEKTRSHPSWLRLHQSIIKESDAIINRLPVERIKIGMRLLDKSRTCLMRVFYLSYAYRTTNEKKYLKRAEAEMLAAASFSDWNPSHFLDVAEMTMALAIGYDWLYKELTTDSRRLIKEAILQKGIQPSLQENNNGWLRSSNNWNQVCNAGMAYGALAIYEDYPDLAIRIINRAIKTMAIPMREYSPDGGYPEGYMYWGYGTSFNVMFISALQKAFSNDFRLISQPGFSETAYFLQHLYGTSGKVFNYGDCSNGTQFNPAVLWFADYQRDPSLLWMELPLMNTRKLAGDRLLPAAMIWGMGTTLDNINAPAKKVWVGKGHNQVAMLRTSWTDSLAVFVGFKTGSPSASHGHMDVGSFVMDALGERWAMDMGFQDYESLESNGIKIWNFSQEADRWKVLRYNNLAHNTLTVNKQLQLVKEKATIDSYSARPDFLNATSDLSRLYDSTNRSSFKRGVAIMEEKYVTIKDEVTIGNKPATIRWSMVTHASVKIINDTLAELTSRGKKLLMTMRLPVKGAFKIWSTAPVTKYDAPNPGTSIIGFEVILPAAASYTFSVQLLPQYDKPYTPYDSPPLADWPRD